MDKREFDFDEPIIFCSHNFDISNRVDFATALANRLGVNINITEGSDNIIDTIRIPDATITKNLYFQNSKFKNDFKYVLEHGDEAHLFYDNYLQYYLPFILDYEILIKDLKYLMNHREEIVFHGIYDLKQFGADKVYIANQNQLKLTSDDKEDWLKVINVITNSNHFIYNL